MSAKKASSKRVVETRKMPDTKSKVQTETASKSQGPVELPFSRMNYILLIGGIFLIALGFLLMATEDFIDATQFSIALYIAPILVVGGFVEIIFAIMYKPKTPSANE